MLPYVLVFLFAQSALSLPSVGVNLYNYENELGTIPDNGQLVNRNVSVSTFEYIDASDIPLYANMYMDSIVDTCGLNTPAAQASCIISTLTFVGEMAYGIPGDACRSAALINSVVSNSPNQRSALNNYVQLINSYIDTISGLVMNPNSARYSSAPRGNCLGGGRNYQIIEAWDLILDNCDSVQLSGAGSLDLCSLLNEQSCAARRLSTANNVRSNNLAATLTASATPLVSRIVRGAQVPLGNFLRVVAAGGNPLRAAANAKNAVNQSASRISC